MTAQMIPSSVSLIEVLSWLLPHGALRIGDYLVEHKKVCFWVTTPYGRREVTTVEEVFILLRGGWFCNKCRAEPGIEHFSIITSGDHERYRPICDDCMALTRSTWYQKRKRKRTFRDRRNFFARRWRAAHREHYRNHQNTYRRAHKRQVIWRRVFARQEVST